MKFANVFVDPLTSFVACSHFNVYTMQGCVSHKVGDVMILGCEQSCSCPQSIFQL